MSRYRSNSGDLAYGDEPQRWDRDRFERIRVGERDRPGRTDIRIEERIERRAPRRLAERDLYAEDYSPPARLASRPRRSDRDLFGEEDPRDIAERSLQPYRRKDVDQEVDIEIERERRRVAVPRPRPGLMRRQSSLDTFDRRPLPKYEREDYRLPANIEIPLPRRRSPPRRVREEEFEEIRYHDIEPQDYRDVEILREREIHRTGRAKSTSGKSVSGKSVAKSTKSGARSVKSDARSVTTARSESSDSSFEEVSRASSPSPERKVGKKGKTRMPKRLVKKQAVIELGYPYEEEEDFIIVRRALEKEQIDEVIRISETYKDSNKVMTYRYDEEVAAPPPPAEVYEALRTEWINPPSVRGPPTVREPSVRAPSPARSTRTRRTSPARTVRAPSPVRTVRAYSPARTVRAPSPPPFRQEQIIIEQRPAPPPPPPPAPLTIVLPERRERSERDVKAEIRALEAEQRALQLERDASIRRETDRREIVLRRPEEDYEVVEYRPREERRQITEYVERERERSPKRETVRIEKDRKGRMALVRSAH